jgi:hypothetical protein
VSSGGITEAELTAKLAALQSQINGIAGQPPLTSAGILQSFALTNAAAGNSTGATLNAVTVNGVRGLAAADIPSLAYLPSTGGTVSGNLTVTGAFSGGALSLANASTTLLSVLGPAYFGATATSSSNSAGALTMASNILSTLNTSSAPLSLGNWNSISTAFTGDLSHMGLGISRQTTGTSLGSPTSGYLLTRELAGVASYDYNSSGNNQQTGGNDGRTGARNFYAKNDNYGQGDSTSYFCDNFVGSTRSGATSFLASPQVGCLSGQLFAGTDGSFLQGVGDINFKDQGHDAAVVGLNFNFTRTNATGNINANWGAWTFQNQGTLPIDWMLRATGAVRTGLDLSALTFPDVTLVSVALSSGGTGYTVGNLLSPPDGTTDQKTVIKVMTVNGSGVILTFAIDRAGLYGVAPASPSSVTGGTGSGASFTLQYSTASSKPALVTKSDNCWYGNATQDTGVYTTSYSSTLKLGTAWVCFSSSLGAWNVVAGNNSVLQLYNNQVIANTTFKTTANVGISTTSAPLSALVVSGAAAIGADYNLAAPTNGLIVEGKTGIGTTTPFGKFALSLNNSETYPGNNAFIIASSTASAPSTLFTVLNTGSIGIGTTTPWRTLSVTGTVGFDGITSVSTNQSAYLCLSSNKEVVQDSTTCLASSARFKQNIAPLSASSSLAEVMALNPVSFQYTPEYNGALQSDPNFSGTFVGFIAEDVAKVDSRLITVDATGTTPSAPHGVRYENITAILAGAIQDIASISGVFKDNLIAWLGDASNGIGKFFAGEVDAGKLCARKSDGTYACVTGDQFAAVLAQAGQGSSASSSASSTDAVFTSPITITDVPPDTATTTADTSSTATTTPEATTTPS